MIDRAKLRSAMAMIIDAIGEDPFREGLRETPRRVADMYEELFQGLEVEPESELNTVFEEGASHGELAVLRDIPFHSICEHHFLPFFGKAHIAYAPDRKIAGASKLARALDAVARRPQLQERITSRLADAIHNVLQPHRTGVVIEAEHLCMIMRGVKKEGSLIATSAFRGAFDPNGSDKAELLAALYGRRP